MHDIEEPRIWLEGLRADGMRPGPEVTAALLDRLGLATPSWRTLHIAGSNGKGTAAAMTAAALQIAGERVGLFTSPHVARVEERTRVDGRPIRSRALDRALVVLQRATVGEGFRPKVPAACIDSEPKPRIFESRGMVGEPLTTTYYEATLLAAVIACTEVGVDWFVMETGLGGRLDATMALPAAGALITSLSLEHTDLLGTSLAEIATEKAAIARPGRPLVTREVLDGPARAAVGRQAVANEASGVTWVPMPGGTMREEAAILAEALLRAVGADAAADVVSQALVATRWPTRLQTIRLDDGHSLLLDAAHNPSGIARLATELASRAPFDGLILGSSPQTREDEWRAALTSLIEHLTPGAPIILTEPQHGRCPAMPVAELKAILSSTSDGHPLHSAPTPDAALALLRTLSSPFSPSRTWLSTGSLYLQGELLSLLGRDTDDDLSLLLLSRPRRPFPRPASTPTLTRILDGGPRRPKDDDRDGPRPRTGRRGPPSG